MNQYVTKKKSFSSNKWIFIINFLWGRSWSPWQNPEFIGYFFFIVVLIGGNGIWYTYWEQHHAASFNDKAFIISLASYAVALTTSGAADLVLSQVPINRNVIVMTGVSLLLFSLVLFILCAIIANIDLAYKLSAISLLVAFFTWWVANADKLELGGDGGDTTTAINTIGGGTVKPSSPSLADTTLPGDLTGIQS